MVRLFFVVQASGLTLLWFGHIVAHGYIERPSSIWTIDVSPFIVGLAWSVGLTMYIGSLAILAESDVVQVSVTNWTPRLAFVVSNILGLCLMGCGYLCIQFKIDATWLTLMRFWAVGFCWSVGPILYLISLTLLPCFPMFPSRASQTIFIIGLVVWVLAGSPAPDIPDWWQQNGDKVAKKESKTDARQAMRKLGLRDRQITAILSPHFCSSCLNLQKYCVCDLRRIEAESDRLWNKLLYPSLEEMSDPEWKSPIRSKYEFPPVRRI